MKTSRLIRLANLLLLVIVLLGLPSRAGRFMTNNIPYTGYRSDSTQ